MMNTDFIFRETGIDSCFDEIYISQSLFFVILIANNLELFFKF